MKNTRKIEIYCEMLRYLKKRIDQADGIFMEMSQKIIGGMTGKCFNTVSLLEQKALERKYCTILADVMEGLSAVCHERIRMFPIPDSAGMIEKMEKRYEQLEELERILDDLMEEAGLKDRKDNRQSHNLWRSNMVDINFKAEFERNFSEAEQLCKRPNILVAGDTGSSKTSLIRTLLGSELVPAEGIGNSLPSVPAGSSSTVTKTRTFGEQNWKAHDGYKDDPEGRIRHEALRNSKQI